MSEAESSTTAGKPPGKKSSSQDTTPHQTSAEVDLARTREALAEAVSQGKRSDQEVQYLRQQLADAQEKARRHEESALQHIQDNQWLQSELAKQKELARSGGGASSSELKDLKDKLQEVRNWMATVDTQVQGAVLGAAQAQRLAASATTKAEAGGGYDGSLCPKEMLLQPKQWKVDWFKAPVQRHLFEQMIMEHYTKKVIPEDSKARDFHEVKALIEVVKDALVTWVSASLHPQATADESLIQVVENARLTIHNAIGRLQLLYIKNIPEGGPELMRELELKRKASCLDPSYQAEMDYVFKRHYEKTSLKTALDSHMKTVPKKGSPTA